MRGEREETSLHKVMEEDFMTVRLKSIRDRYCNSVIETSAVGVTEDYRNSHDLAFAGH